MLPFRGVWKFSFVSRDPLLSRATNIAGDSAQVLSGETRFSPDKAYPEKFGAEAPEQPQNTARVKKVGFSPSALAPAAGAKHGGRNQTAAGQLAEYRITAQALRHC